jgi:hypothetical protein
MPPRPPAPPQGVQLAPPLAPVPVGVQAVPPPPPPAAAEGRSGAASPWVRLLPSVLLGLTLVGIFCRDLTVKEDKPDDPEPEPVLAEPEIDPNPRVTLVYVEPTMQFGLTTKDRRGNPKKLTFIGKMKLGNREVNKLTSYAGVRIDGKAYKPGEWIMIHGSTPKEGEIKRTDNVEILYPGSWAEKPVGLKKDSTGQHEGQRCAWRWDKSKVVCTQTVEIIAGQVDPASGKRLLDTCLIHFTLTNKDTRSHKVGMRFLLDTYIGDNDGVPFYIPRKDNPLVDTKADFPPSGEIPDYVQALEFPKLDKPGTVARVSLKIGGGLEAPNRVSLTHHIRTLPTYNEAEKEVQVEYEIPLADIRGNPSADEDDQKKADSAVALYWAERELAPGEERKLGFAYGLGQLASGEGGRLGVTPPTNPRAGEDFPLTAYVSDPVEGQSVELILPRSLQLVEGNAKQQVPAVAPDAASRNSSVTWRIKAEKAGTYKLWVRSSTGEKQALTVVVAARESIFK